MAPTDLKIGRNRTLEINVLDHASEASPASYTISCGDATSVDNTRLTDVTHTGSSCAFTVNPIDTLAPALQGDATFTVPLTSEGGHTRNAAFTVEVGPDSTISYMAPTGLKIGRNRTLEINVLDHASEASPASYAISCGDATSVHSRLTGVTHTGSSCAFTVNPIDTLTPAQQGAATFTVPLTSEGGHTRNAAFTVEVGPDSTISYMAPTDLKIGRNRTLEINVLDHATEASPASYTITCGDAINIDNTRLTGVTHTGNSCDFTVNPIDTLAPALQGDASFTVPLTSDGGHTRNAAFSVEIGPDSSIVFTPPGQQMPPVSLIVQAGAAWTFDLLSAPSSDAVPYATDGDYDISCGAATDIDARLRSVTRLPDTCRYRITAGSATGTGTFTVPYSSDGGDTHQGQITITIAAPPAVLLPSPPPTTTTTTTVAPTTTTTTTVPTPTTAAVPPAAALEPDVPGPRWNTLTVLRGGTTIQRIRESLRTSPGYSIYDWNPQRRAWSRLTSPAQAIPAGTYLSLRTDRAPDAEGLAEANLGGGPRTLSLAQGWNLLGVPESVSREDDNADFLFAAQLTDCDNLRGVLVIASYSARTRKWQISLPCHPAAQARLTTGDNPPYRPLAAVSPADTTYIYTRTRLAIAWNTTTKTYQTARRFLG